MQYFEKHLSKEISAKSMKIFGPPTTKWRLCKSFAKLNGNHILMANIFKLHEYQTFGLVKMHNMSKIWFANNKFNLLRWNKMYFFTIFQGLSVVRNCVRPETASLTVLAIKRGLLCNFAKIFKGRHFMGHSGTDLKFSITIEF